MSAYSKSHVLVTGGAGFIGSHLCRALQSAGFSTKVLDLKTGGDILDPAALAQAMDGAHAVYHLAAIVSMPRCEEFPEESERTNFIGSARVFEAALERKIPVVYSSSAAVYGPGSPVSGEALREDRPTDPRSNYARQKLLSEEAARTLVAAGLRACVFRFFNVFGPGQDPRSPYSGVVSRFVEAWKQGRPLELHGDGEQTRDFISIHDLCKVLVGVLSSVDPQIWDGKPINLGAGRPTSIRELVEHFRARGASVEQKPSRGPGDPRHSCASIERARARFGFVPEWDLKRGLAELL